VKQKAYYQPNAVELVAPDLKSVGLKIIRFDIIDEELEY
jgi:hypothetical protein